MAGMAFARGVETPGELLSKLGLSYAFLEGPALTEMKDCATSLPETWPWSGCERGVAFGATCEVRFRRRDHDGRWHLVLTTDAILAPGEPWRGWREIRAAKKWRSHVILWGEPDSEAGGWFEGRIPRALPYGFRTDVAETRVAAVVKRYRLPRSGEEVRRYSGLTLLDDFGKEIENGIAGI
jgi:hypothetical protein